tara:strand:- start:1705 stop:2613 length:909 start_codon:yes stop_codon:yes gene_type:complete
MSARVPVDAEKFRRDGYLVMPGAFSHDEVSAYREHLLAKFEGGNGPADYSGDLFANPATESFIGDGRLIEVCRDLLGGEPVYFGDSSAMYYASDNNVCSFHKDNADRHNPDAPDWSGDYPIIRFGLYLQDHSRQGGGLMLCAGSHKSVARNRKLEVLNEEVFGWFSGRTRYVPSGVGDLIVWNLRTTHAGMGRYLRGPIRRPISERTQHLVPSFMQSKLADSRLAMFASFGLAGRHLDRYLRYLKTRTYMVDIWRQTPYTPGMFAKFEAQNAKLLDMHGEVSADIAAGRSVGEYTYWTPLSA